jgi:hypothetical protein
MTGTVAAVTRPVNATATQPYRQSTRMPVILLALATAVPLLSLFWREGSIPEGARVRASILWLLCMLPGWIYLRTPARSRPPIPFLALVGVSFGLYNVLAAALGMVASFESVDYTGFVRLDPARDYQRPLELLLYGWMALLLGYWAVGIFLRRRPHPLFAIRLSLTSPVMREWGMRLLWGGLLAEALRQTAPLPTVLRGLFNFLAALSLFGGALLVILGARRRLDARSRLLLLAGLVLLILLRIGTGSLAGVLFALLTMLLALWVGGGHLRLRWVVIGVVGGIVTASLRGVAIEYRHTAWYTEEALPLPKRSALMLQLLADKADRMGVQGAVLDGFRVSAGRSANLDLMADVIRQTPRWVPYWGGQTYLSLAGLAVPRVLWPGKPEKTLGQDFGHRYRYLNPSDRWTSVNLPFVVEFYANFGDMGVLLGMLLVGAIYRLLERLVNVAGQHPVTSVCGLVLLIPLLNVESDFSLIFGGLVLNGAALWTVMKLIERSGRARERAAPATPQARAPAMPAPIDAPDSLPGVH